MKVFSKDQLKLLLNELDFSKIEGNLIPIITQDFNTNQVLMMAFADKKAVSKSLSTGYVHYYSRSKKRLWKKGEQSGHVQEVEKVYIDCDNDSILFTVKQHVAACHNGYFSCFYKEFINGEIKIIGKKLFQPEEVYNSSE